MSVAALQAICDLALPRACAGCNEPRVALCARCSTELADASTASPFPVRPMPCPAGFPPTWSQVPYDGALAALLRAFKDSGRSDVGPQLGRLLRASLAAVLQQDDSCRRALQAGQRVLVVPMPSRPTSIRARGRQPTVELARHAVGRAPPLVLRRLLRVTGTRDQAGLTAHDRSVNLRGAMRVSANGRAAVPGRVCLVVDDIVTTGSSLVEARATLLAAGAADVVAATVAATQRHGG